MHFLYPRKYYFLLNLAALSFFLPSLSSAQTASIHTVVHDQSFERYHVVSTPELYSESWNSASEVHFWRMIMRISPDSSLIYTPGSRTILEGINTHTWFKMSPWKRAEYLDQVRAKYGWNGKLLVAQGKKTFYEIDKVIDHISEAVPIFEEEGVDSWYAQAILLIESPGKLLKSSAGAYGPFQLMKSIAIKCGLIVNERVDERADLRKSSKAAAHMLKTICIPETRLLMKRFKLPIDEQSIWFKLMVLHVYHAGMGNVQAVLTKIKPRKGGKALIYAMWRTESKYFKNASQNYSQLALASHMELDRMIWLDYHQECISDTQEEEAYDYLQLLTMR